MSALLGSRKARLGLLRLGAPSSRPFLADLPSALTLEARASVLGLSEGRGLAVDGRSTAVALEDRGSRASLQVRHTDLAAPAAARALGLADDERSLGLDG